MFRYCENNHDRIEKPFNEFLKSYTILQAIKDIEKAWMQVPEATIRKSFRKVFPKDKWDQLTYENEPDVGYSFEGFVEQDQVQYIPSHYLPGNDGERSQVINANFDTDIDEILAGLNGIEEGLVFRREHIVEDVLLNPEPSDDNVDNIIREVLDVQDVIWSGEDMNEVDNVPQQQDNMRPKVFKTLGRISHLE